jgi:hypothetical protein
VPVPDDTAVYEADPPTSIDDDPVIEVQSRELAVVAIFLTH